MNAMTVFKPMSELQGDQSIEGYESTEGHEMIALQDYLDFSPLMLHSDPQVQWFQQDSPGQWQLVQDFIEILDQLPLTWWESRKRWIRWFHKASPIANVMDYVMAPMKPIQCLSRWASMSQLQGDQSIEGYESTEGHEMIALQDYLDFSPLMLHSDPQVQWFQQDSPGQWQLVQDFIEILDQLPLTWWESRKRWIRWFHKASPIANVMDYVMAPMKPIQCLSRWASMSQLQGDQSIEGYESTEGHEMIALQDYLDFSPLMLHSDPQLQWFQQDSPGQWQLVQDFIYWSLGPIAIDLVRIKKTMDKMVSPCFTHC